LTKELYHVQTTFKKNEEAVTPMTWRLFNSLNRVGQHINLIMKGDRL